MDTSGSMSGAANKRNVIQTITAAIHDQAIGGKIPEVILYTGKSSDVNLVDWNTTTIGIESTNAGSLWNEVEGVVHSSWKNISGNEAMMTAMYSVIDDVISSHDLIMSPIRAMTFVILSYMLNGDQNMYIQTLY